MTLVFSTDLILVPLDYFTSLSILLTFTFMLLLTKKFANCLIGQPKCFLVKMLKLTGEFESKGVCTFLHCFPSHGDWGGAHDWVPCSHARFIQVEEEEWINNTTFCVGSDSVCMVSN